MNEDDVRAAFSKLPPVREFPGDRVWMQRVATIEDFLGNGPFVASAFRRDQEDFGADFVADFRRMDPERYDLLLRAFP